MSYNSNLQNKNLKLQEILNKINNLPEAGSGEGVELPELNNEGQASDLLAGKELIDSEGNIVTGSMPNNGAVSKTLDVNTTSFTIPSGFHNGNGKVSITTETKSVTPTKSGQTIEPTSGKVLSMVSVNAIPDEYITTTDATATASDMLSGKTAYVKGSKVTGNIPNNGAISATFNGLDTKSYTIPVGYTSGGTVSLDNTIDNEVDEQADLINQIKNILAEKATYNTVHVGNATPTNDIGVDGDIYIVRSET